MFKRLHSSFIYIFVFLILVSTASFAKDYQDIQLLSEFPQNQVIVELNADQGESFWTTQNQALTKLYQKYGKPKITKTFSHLVEKSDTTRMIELNFFQPFDLRWKMRLLGQNSYPIPGFHQYYTLTFDKPSLALDILLKELQEIQNIKTAYPDLIAKIQQQNTNFEWLKPWLTENGYTQIASLDFGKLSSIQLQWALNTINKPESTDYVTYSHPEKDEHFIYFQGLKKPLAKTACTSTEGTEDVCAQNIFVKFVPRTTATERNAILEPLKAKSVHNLAIIDTHIVELQGSLSVMEVLENLSRQPKVLYAEPDYQSYQLASLPNDPLFSNQLELYNESTPAADINAYEAWSVYSTGTADPIVAVIDTGIMGITDFFAEDYKDCFDSSKYKQTQRETTLCLYGEKSNLYLNEAELNRYFDCVESYSDPSWGHYHCSKIKDWDGNLYNNDWYGYDPINNTGSSYSVSEAYGAARHGTTVASIIGAYGNNSLETVGVNWRIKLMSIPLFNDPEALEDYEALTTRESTSIEYAATQGAKIVNMSYDYVVKSETIEALIKNYSQILFVAAAGNYSGVLHPDKSGSEVIYPCLYSIEASNVLCIGGHDTSEKKNITSTSNISDVYLHLAAPSDGYALYSINKKEDLGEVVYYGSDGYDSVYNRRDIGTSAAVAYVSGVAANILANFPTHSTAQIKTCLLEGAEIVDSLKLYVSGGRALDMKGSLDYCSGLTPDDSTTSGTDTESCEEEAKAMTTSKECTENGNIWDVTTNTCACGLSGAAGAAGEKGGFTGCSLHQQSHHQTNAIPLVVFGMMSLVILLRARFRYGH